VNKKALLAVLALSMLFLAAPFVGVAYAGKGTTKQYYEFFLQGSYGPGPDTTIMTTADGITQIRNLHYFASYIEVTVGTTTYYPDPESYSATMDFTLDTNTATLYARVHETFSINGGTISQQTAEVVTDYGTLYNGGGNFVGFGSEGLDGVKIQGTSAFGFKAGLGAGLDRVGTIMGWA
jgi:hypothetical protein